MGKKLLLISAHPEDKPFAEKVAATANLGFQFTDNANDGAEIIAKQNDIAIILADTSSEKQYQELEAAIQAKMGLFSERINANAIHFISSEELENVPYLIHSPIFGHFIIRNYDNPKESGEHYGHIVAATLAERAFGLETLLKPNTKIQTIKLKESTQKQEAVEAIRNYLLAAKFQSRMASVIANAVDELLMNAIFDAPVDSLGHQTLAQTPRKTLLKLEGQHEVEMHVGYDGHYVGVSATDLFGSLDKAKLLSHISKTYTDQEYKVKTTVAGAGIGLATVFRSGGSFFFVSESRTKTEVTVFFRRTDSFREFNNQFRFISTQFYF